TLAPNTATSTNVPVTLQAGKVSVSTLTLPTTNDFVIQGVTLQLNINYHNHPRLQAPPGAPAATPIPPFSSVGNNGPHRDLLHTIFDDNARDPQGNTVPVRTGVAPFNSPGTYNPMQPLNVLVGKRAAGTYRLEILNRGTSNLTADQLTRW